MNNLLAQALFTTAYQGIVAQGKPAITKSGGCAYRTTDGLKCAVGFLIDDETADIWDKFGGMEDVQEQLILRGKKLPEWAETHFDMLVEIQTIHDGSTFIDEDFIPYFEREMGLIAEKYGLTVPA